MWTDPVLEVEDCGQELRCYLLVLHRSREVEEELSRSFGISGVQLLSYTAKELVNILVGVANVEKRKLNLPICL